MEKIGRQGSSVQSSSLSPVTPSKQFLTLAAAIATHLGRVFSRLRGSIPLFFDVHILTRSVSLALSRQHCLCCPASSIYLCRSGFFLEWWTRVGKGHSNVHPYYILSIFAGEKFTISEQRLGRNFREKWTRGVFRVLFKKRFEKSP